MSEGKQTYSSMSVYQLLTQVYGPYAFGVVTLLLIWFSIVRPELSSRDIQWDSHQEVLQAEREIVSAMEATSRTMQTTAVIMERTVKLLEDQGG